MKAYKVYDISHDEGYQDIIFAKTAQEAKIKAFGTSPACESSEWIDLRVGRVPYLDGMENCTERELMYVAIENGWWYEVDGIKYDEENLEEAVKEGIVTPFKQEESEGDEQ